MVKNQADLTRWALRKSTEYLESAQLHRAGYQPHTVFNLKTITQHAKLAEELLAQATSMSA